LTPCVVTHWKSLSSWPLLRRCALVMGLFSLLEAFYLLWKLCATHIPALAPHLNVAYIQSVMPLSFLILLASLALTGLCLFLDTRRQWLSLLITHFCALCITLSLCYHGYLVGMMTPATGIMLIAIPILGILILGRQFVYPYLIMAVPVVTLITYASITNSIAYGPIFKNIKPPVTPDFLFLFQTIGLFALPMIIGSIVLFDLVLCLLRNSESDNLRLSQTDHLTGLWNRRYLQECLIRQTKSPTFTSMALIHIDAFKRINDQCGNLVGDQMLQDIAKVLQQHSQPNDWIGRFSGVEFMLLMTDTSLEDAYARCERCRLAISQMDCVSFKQSWPLSASVGLIAIDTPFDINNSVSMVSQMLYQAKQRGGNCTILTEQLIKAPLPHAGSTPVMRQ
jgi:diguanylate cyclase (GGDEF)-like protein